MHYHHIEVNKSGNYRPAVPGHYGKAHYDLRELNTCKGSRVVWSGYNIQLGQNYAKIETCAEFYSVNVKVPYPSLAHHDEFLTTGG